MEGWGNSPMLEIEIEEEFPPLEEFLYKEIRLSHGTAYWAEKNGFVSFFWHDPKNERGYGGWEFSLRVHTGPDESEVRIIKGPWSSRSGTMNPIFPHSVDCVVNNLAAHITLDSAIKAIEMIPETGLAQVSWHGDLEYIPCHYHGPDSWELKDTNESYADITLVYPS
jgi:hypothetical protein